MSEIKSAANIDVSIVLKLNEHEARALMQIVGYGSKPFIEWFYRNLGKHYLKPHENALVSLFKTIGDELPKHLTKADEARKIFTKQETK